MKQPDALIVDDSMSARFALTRSLEPLGLKITSAKTAEEALEVAGNGRFDIIFMDHVLPGISGLDAVEQLRQTPQYASTPIIMCSSNDGEAYKTEALQRGANAVIGKPPEPSLLARVLKEQLSQTDQPAAPAETPLESAQVTDSEKLKALDERLDRLEAMLERLEQSVAQVHTRTQATARVIADLAGRDLANRVLRAVVALKGK